MSNHLDLAQILRRSKMLGSLKSDQLAAVARIGRLRLARQGQRLFNQGAECEGLFVIGSGQVKVFNASPQGKEHILHMVRPGETFAEAALFGGFDYPASAEAVTDCQLVFLPKTPMLALLAEHPAVPLKLLAGMSIWLRRMVDLLEDLVLRDAAGRVANHILSLRFGEEGGGPRKSGRGLKPVVSHGQATGRQGPPAGPLSVKLTLKHQELAAHLGLTRETISRTLAHLETLGLIMLLPKGRIALKDVAGLRELAGLSNPSR